MDEDGSHFLEGSSHDGGKRNPVKLKRVVANLIIKFVPSYLLYIWFLCLVFLSWYVCVYIYIYGILHAGIN